MGTSLQGKGENDCSESMGGFLKVYTESLKEWMGWEALGIQLFVFGCYRLGGIRLGNRIRA